MPSALAPVAAAVVLTLMLVLNPQSAEAAGAAMKTAFERDEDFFYTANSSDGGYWYRNHRVADEDQVSPSNTTINLFDYWVDDAQDTDAFYEAAQQSRNYKMTHNGTNNDGQVRDTDALTDIETGINEGHQLKFSTGNNVEAGTANAGKESNYHPTDGIVESALGEDGYPVTKDYTDANGGYYLTGPDGKLHRESLSYLFDDTNHSGKASFMDVQGLLQRDSNGYFGYDSSNCYAAFDASTNSFALYKNTSVVWSDVTGLGQFFPFTPAYRAMGRDGQNDSASGNAGMNHYFGLTMSTDFVQPEGGITSNGDKMTYEFSGDDDVWIFIDDVLVADLGGLHNEVTASINFSDGMVQINNGDTSQAPLSGADNTYTLREAFEKAGKAGDAAWNDGGNGDTFADNTTHTLKLFYLERGNFDSNLKLRFNLESIPTSGVVKVDQQGEILQGATFEVYATDETYAVADDAQPVASGTTDEDGTLTFMNNSGEVFTFAGLNSRTGADHFVLRETETPDGYRTAGDIHVYYGSGTAYCENSWENGVFTSADVTVTAPTGYIVVDKSKDDSKEYVIKTNYNGGGNGLALFENPRGSGYQLRYRGGIMFAVVLQREPDVEGSIEDAASWHAVYRDPDSGEWKVTESTAENGQAILDAAQKGGSWELQLSDETGCWTARMDDLPGDVSKYYHVMAEDNRSDAEYALAFYYAKTDSIESATTDTLYHLEDLLTVDDPGYGWHPFSYQRSVSFEVPDARNSLTVQKTDEKGDPLKDVEFYLYNANEVEYGETTGAVTPHEDAEPLSQTTTDDGKAVFDGLNSGNYYLVEHSAPAGYKVRSEAVQVVVNDDGVFVDAGAANDGVTVSRGVGTLSSTMNEYISESGSDAVLTHLTATQVTGDSVDTMAAAEDAPSMNLKYDEDGSKDGTLVYTNEDKDGRTSLTTDEGWSGLRVTQNVDKKDPTAQDLGDQDLSGLFSGDVTVTISNERAADLQVSKTIEAYEDAPEETVRVLQDKNFSFTVELFEDGENEGETTPLAGEYPLVTVDEDGEDVPLTDAEGNQVVVRDGTATFTLKDGESAYIRDLPLGVRYKVTEASEEGDGFSCKVAVDGKDVEADVTDESDTGARTANGTISDADDDASKRVTAKVEFTNSYDPAPGTLTGKDNLNVTKTLTGREWQQNEQFTFSMKLKSYQANADAKKATKGDESFDAITNADGIAKTGSIKIGKPNEGVSNTVNFGDLAFDKAGIYTYTITEIDTSQDENLAISRAQYRVVITVADNGDGKLTSEVTSFKQLKNDAGDKLAKADQVDVLETKTATFTNAYTAQQQTKTVSVKPADGSATIKDANGKLVGVGDTLTYTINWVNDAIDENGNAVAANVTVTDVVPEGTTLLPESISNKGAVEDGTITWNLGEQKANAFGSVSFKVTVDDQAGDATVDTIANTANVTMTIGENDPQTKTTPTNDTTVNVPGKAHTLEGSEGNGDDGAEAVHVGDKITYTIAYQNTESTEATVTVKDTVPAGTELVEAKGAARDTDEDGNTVLTWTRAEQAPGATGTVSFTVRVTEAAVGTSVENQATVKVGKNSPECKTNTDKTTPVDSGSLTISKTVDAGTSGAALDPDQKFSFTVELASADGTPLTGEYEYVVTKANGKQGEPKALKLNAKGKGTIKLKAGQSATITGLPEGASYTVTEKDVPAGFVCAIDGAAEGMTPDKGVITVGAKAQVAFTNTYAPAAATNVPTGLTKQLEGREPGLQEGEFTFQMTVTPTDDTPADGFAMPSGGTDPVTTTNKADGSIEFDNITFTKVGTYTVTVSEVVPADEAKAPFMKYDEHAYSYDVVVTAEGASLKATVDKDSEEGSKTFTNTYAIPGTASSILTINKNVTGNDSNANFTFGLKLTQGDASGVVFPETVTVAGADGAIADGETGNTTANITFSKAGTYVFEVTEAEDELPVGWTNQNPNGHKVAYAVADDGKDGLELTSVAVDGTKLDVDKGASVARATVEFTNAYDVTYDGSGVATEATFSKELKGRDWKDGDAFTFKIEGQDGAPLPVDENGNPVSEVTVKSAEEAKSFSFGTFKYTLDDVKDAENRTKQFVYTVSEVRPDAEGAMPEGYTKVPGVTYDAHTATLTVTVADDGQGNLVATAANEGSAFTNTYSASVDYTALAGIQLQKTLTGRDMAAGQFAFTVSGDKDTLDKLGLSSDKDAYPVTAAKDGGASTIDLFNGKTVTFTDADVGKTYAFDVAETKTGGAGYTNDEAVRHVQIAVAYDDATGVLTVTTTVTTGEGNAAQTVAQTTVTSADATGAADAKQVATVPFSNSYAATGEIPSTGDAALHATKTLTGRPMNEGEFSFQVALGDQVVATGTNAAAGDGEAADITFTPIAFSNADATDSASTLLLSQGVRGTGERANQYTFQLTVSEVTDGLAGTGVTATSANATVLVAVTDEGDGTLTPQVTYAAGTGSVAFSNSYATNKTVPVTITGTKVLDRADASLTTNWADVAENFTFTLTGVDEDGNAAPLPQTTEVKADAATGQIDFGQIAFAQPEVMDGIEPDQNGMRTRIFTYTVTENGAAGGVTNGAAQSFTVTLTEDTTTGQLTAVASPVEGSVAAGADTGAGTGALFTIANTYGVRPVESSITDEGQLMIAKTISGRDLVAGEFQFEMAEGDQVVATGTNDAAGKVTFGAVRFDVPGEHDYTIREVPDGAAELGVTFDTKTVTAHASVVDNGDGTLGVTWSFTPVAGQEAAGDSVTFENAYQASDATLSLTAFKQLNGRDLAEGEFDFELTYSNADGEQALRATNAANGAVQFPQMTFNQAGTYTVTVREVAGDDAQVTYDDAEHTATVVVEDDLQGSLKVTSVTWDSDEVPVFVNTYTEEEEPGDEPGKEPGEEPGDDQPGDDVPDDQPGDDVSGDDGGDNDNSGNTTGDGGKTDGGKTDGGQKPSGTKPAASTKTSASMPQTGDNAPAVVGAIAVAGVSLVGAGGYLLHRKRR